jgi:hypothetical protein
MAATVLVSGSDFYTPSSTAAKAWFGELGRQKGSLPMRPSITAAVVVFVALAGFVLPAHAELLSGTFSGESTLTPTGTPGVFVQNFTGHGVDATFGSFTAQSTSTIDFSRPPSITVSGGILSEVFSQGSFSGTSSGDGTASGRGTATFEADVVITGGTGIFAGATGEVTLTGTITATSPTTELITGGTYTGSFTPIPEPSSFSLVTVAIVVGAGALFRQGRRSRLRPSRAVLVRPEH